MAQAIDSLTLDLAGKSLDALWERSNVISNNIANSDTANYKEKSVSFENELSSALGDGSLTQSELNGITPQVVTNQGSMDANGNSVDVDSQMVELTRNQLQYTYMSKAAASSLDMLRNAASEGRN
ncbi:MAG: flagellar basal body rod protein FlgB [Clostridia bacterium]|nr:flagellar basal body rod protein FlgB [Clostridia bacterium]